MDNDIKNLRTYEEDIKDALDQGGVTTTQIVLAEQRKKQRPQPMQLVPEKERRNTNIIRNVLGTLVFFLLATAIFYGVTKYVLPLKKSSEPTVQKIAVDFLTVDKRFPLQTKGKNYGEILFEINLELENDSKYKTDEIVEVEVIKSITTGSGETKKESLQKITSSDFFKLIDSRAPDNLIRSFDSKIFIGGHKKEKVEPFIILRVKNYEQSFAGMLSWEPDIIRDVKSIFEKKLRENNLDEASALLAQQSNLANASTSSSTPVQNILPIYNPKKFVDVVIMNKDTRAIKNSSNEVIFFYSFVDKENLVMTTNIDTLRKIISGLNTANLIR